MHQHLQLEALTKNDDNDDVSSESWMSSFSDNN
jgi:hypothetical protein